jgi:hypothetical protein
MQDIVGILHGAFMSNETRKMVLEGVKRLFMSYRVQQAK